MKSDFKHVTSSDVKWTFRVALFFSILTTYFFKIYDYLHYTLYLLKTYMCT
jgi:hypothetical protein